MHQKKFGMKQHSTIKTALAVLLSLISFEMNAQHHWAMAVLEKGKDKPVIMEYHSVAETAENGKEYHRIFDDGYRFRNETYNPVKLQYGYRWADRQMYIYDFENAKETLAFDFNLTAGDHFTTFNGMEWEVEAARDTLVNMSFMGKGECVTKKLLTVKTHDGTSRDRWLEDFGSFSGHFMIDSMEGLEISQALWMEYDMGKYLAREITTGPIFAHDSGWLNGAFEASVMPYTVCTYYDDGRLVIEDVQWWYAHRDYICFYQNGDDIYKVYGWELEPHVDLGNSALRRDVITFNGLPMPSSGNYTIHWDDEEYTTGIKNTHSPTQTKDQVYDLQGRRMWSQPTKGIYIKNGVKVYEK